MKNGIWKKCSAGIMALVMLLLVLSGCGGSGNGGSVDQEQKEAEEPVDIVWYVYAQEPNNYEAVMEKFNEKALKDIGMTLNLVFVSQGEYEQKMQLAMAGGDDWDLCFTSHWMNNYLNAAGKGAYLELSEDMLKKNAPEMMNIIPEHFWDGIKVNGKIYGMINYQVMYNQPGMWFDKAALEATGYAPEDIADWDTLNAVMAKLSEQNPGKYPSRGLGFATVNSFMREKPLTLIMEYPWLSFNPETKKIDNHYAFDNLHEFLENVKMWKDKNWVPADTATMGEDLPLITSGQLLSNYNRFKPGADAYVNNLGGPEKICIACGPSTIDTSAVQSTITAVNVNSKHPEEAIRMFNYVFSDKEAANILFFGLEGQDYTMENGRVLRSENGWNVPQWELGNQFNAMLTKDDEDGVWEATMKGNAEANLDVLYGFTPNREPIETELATCEAIWHEYKDILFWGLRDYKEALPEMFDKMQKGGLDKVTAELQKQVDDFLASK